MNETLDQLVSSAGSSFSWGLKILPPSKREAAYALYAFCRAVDDIADGDDDPADKKELLKGWRARIDDCFQGQARELIGRALVDAIAAHQLKREDFIAIIDGMEMDAGDPIYAPTLATLDLYCDRVASAVGRIAVRIFGDHSDAAQLLAYHLGRAFQLTNILRDLKEDAGRRRLYLPREFLDEYQIRETEASIAIMHRKAPEVCHLLSEMADEHYQKSDQLIAACNKEAMKPVRLMRLFYGAIYQRMKDKNFMPPYDHFSLTRFEKLTLLLRFWFGA